MVVSVSSQNGSCVPPDKGYDDTVLFDRKCGRAATLFSILICNLLSSLFAAPVRCRGHRSRVPRSAVSHLPPISRVTPADPVGSVPSLRPNEPLSPSRCNTRTHQDKSEVRQCLLAIVSTE